MAESETLVNNPLSNAEEDEPMLDAQKSTDSVSESDSDSDSDSDNEAEDKSKIEAIEAALLANPSDYDSHVQYIKLLRKVGDIDKLRQARENMSALFPLTSEMWQEWAKDEITAFGADAFSAVEKLYERGVSDYLSVTLWCDYVNSVQEYDPLIRQCSAAGISKARNIFDRALTAAGLHLTEGHRIWEAYREFEEALFLTIEETNSEAKEKQIQRIRNLFHRQLSIPLANLSSTLLTYKAWEANNGSSIDVNSSELDGLPSKVVSGYRKALDMLNARARFEEAISKKDAGTEKLQEFMMYLKFEQSFGDPARIQILYERAIAEFPLSTELWLDYTHYLDKTFKTARLVRDAYGRATRNCPWIGELWVRYLLALERSRVSEAELMTVFETSLMCTFSSYDEYLNVFLTRVDGLRRRFSESTQLEDGLKYAVIRDTFQRASDYLSPLLQNTDSLLDMHSYWARLELKLGKDLVAARGVWESFLKTSGPLLEAWLRYIGMEVEMGNIKEARSLYKRCYCKRFTGTGSEDICHSWERFEREYGSLEDFDVAVQKVTPRLQELQLFRLQQESKNIISATDENDNSKKNAHEKRKATPSSIGGQPSTKRQKSTDQNLKKTNKNDKGRIKESARTSEAAEQHSKTAESASGKEKEGHIKESAHTSEAAERQSKTADSASGKENKGTSSQRSFDDQCTAFVKNLGLQATEDDLRNLFGDDGGVVAVRILKDKFTRKSRGLAYVDFCDDAHLTSALEKNNQVMLGKKVSILKSDPQQGRKKKGDSSSSEHGNVNAEDGSRGRGRGKPQSGRRDENVRLKGKNTFAVPRVRALGWASNDTSKSIPQPESSKEHGDDKPKSNDEFKKMFLKE